jgi:3-oxoacyl-(acyl-carrier-protein) synthase
VSKIFVTGIGVISAIGNSVSENRASLMLAKCGMTHLEHLETKFANKLPFGEVKFSTERLKEKLNIQDKRVTRTSLLALHALQEALHDSSLSSEDIQSKETALIGASTVGGMCLTDEMYRDANLKSTDSPYLSSYDFASVILFLQQHYKINGIVNTINTACSSSANAVMFGARLIKQGLAKRAIVGGADSLAKFTINGFNSLQILSPDICRPFDETRQGLNLGEGAAFLVLEKEEDCAGKTIYAELSGYSNSNDAYHPSSLSPEGNGPYLSMKGALDLADLKPSDIDFINAHGTGTENNDQVESRAMLRLFETVPDFASTKSNVGHTLGAAGAIEAVYSILNLKHQEVYPGLNFNTPISSTGLSPVKNYTQKEIQHVLSNSFGFGGNCSSLIFSKV